VVRGRSFLGLVRIPYISRNGQPSDQSTSAAAMVILPSTATGVVNIKTSVVCVVCCRVRVVPLMRRLGPAYTRSRRGGYVVIYEEVLG
jgi:hypothetical protein